MPWGRSDEEKAQEAAQQAREEEARKVSRAQAQHLASPVGQAETARQLGQGFFQIELDVTTVGVGKQSAFGSSDNTIEHGGGKPDLLSQIEEVGWHLEHVGYVFIETGATTTDRVFGTGQGMVTKGVVTGIYLFRATSSSP